MMKLYYLFLLLQILPFSIFAQNIYVTLNLSDCGSVVNQFRYFKHLDENMDVKIVFNEVYAKSADEIKSKYFENYDYPFVFSDSIHNVIQQNSKYRATVAYLIKDEWQVRNLYTIKNKDIDEMNKSLAFEITLSSPFNKKFKLLGNKYLCVKSGIEEDVILGYDLNGELSFKIELSEEFVLNSFNNFSDALPDQKTIFADLNIASFNTINDYIIFDDEIYTLSYRNYASLLSRDTLIINENFIIDRWDLTGNHIEMITVKLPRTKEMHLYSFHINEDGAYVGFINFNSTLIQEGKFTYLASTHDLDNVDFTIENLFIDPYVYKNYHYSPPLFFDNYYILPLEGKLRKLNNGNVVGKIPLVNGEGEDYGVEKEPKEYVRSFAFKDEKVFMINYKSDDQIMLYKVYDLKLDAFVENKLIEKAVGNEGYVINIDKEIYIYRLKDNKITKIKL